MRVWAAMTGGGGWVQLFDVYHTDDVVTDLTATTLDADKLLDAGDDDESEEAYRNNVEAAIACLHALLMITENSGDQVWSVVVGCVIAHAQRCRPIDCQHCCHRGD
jgi:hypothetical protein